MILNVYLDGVKITGAQTFLASIGDSATASIDLSDYKRGGRAGVALSTPFYRNFVIAMDFWVFGSDTSDLVSKRDSFISYFRLNPDKTATQTKILKFEMANGTFKEIPVVISNVKSSINPNNLQHSIISVIARTELEYFVDSTVNTKSIPIYQGGGMAIPMGIPMDMSSVIGGDAVVINNGGNSEFFPTIRVDGSFNGFVLKNNTTGKQIEYDGILGASDYLEIDMYNRVALKNGSVNALADISGDWWWLAIGDNEILLITTSGDGDAEFTYQDAYRGL